MRTLPRLWHSSELTLNVGDVIERGRWGRQVLEIPGHWRLPLEREFEAMRWETTVEVSRFDCAFAFEDEEYARKWAADTGEFIYEVVPVDLAAPSHRADMLFITWWGKYGEDDERVREGCCQEYWKGTFAGDSMPGHEIRTAWEWLFACDLRVVATPGAS